MPHTEDNKETVDELRAEVKRLKHVLELSVNAERDEAAELLVERDQEIKRLQAELSRWEQEVARLREHRDKAAALLHLANQAIYGLS